jgi:hypothetical protein
MVITQAKDGKRRGQNLKAIGFPESPFSDPKQVSISEKRHAIALTRMVAICKTPSILSVTPTGLTRGNQPMIRSFHSRGSHPFPSRMFNPRLDLELELGVPNSSRSALLLGHMLYHMKRKLDQQCTPISFMHCRKYHTTITSHRKEYKPENRE